LHALYGNLLCTSPRQTIVNTASDGLKLQKDLRKPVEWSVEWQMQFNVKKCKAMHIRKKNIGYEYSIMMLFWTLLD